MKKKNIPFNQEAYKKDLDYAIRLCNKYIYTSDKIRKRLRLKGVSNANINRILAELRKRSLINDELLINAVINELITKCYGEYRIIEKLETLGFPRYLIKAKTLSLNHEKIRLKLLEYINTQKIRKDIIDEDEKKKLYNKCLRRGYDINDVKKFII